MGAKGSKGSKGSKSKKADAHSLPELTAKDKISKPDVSSEDDEPKLISDDEDEDEDDDNGIDQIQLQIIDCMNRLNGASDLFCKKSISDVQFLLDYSHQGSELQLMDVGDILAYMEMTDLFLRIWEESLKMGFLDDVSTLEYAVTKGFLSLMHNYTDASSLLCFQVFESDLPKIFLSYLRSATVSSDEVVLNSVMGILHNVLQKIPVSDQCLREQKAIDVFQRFRNSPDKMIACKALILQGYVITEEENERVNSDDRNFIFMKEILEIALDPNNSDRRGHGFRPIEVILALNRLAVNDKNKERIVNSGLLPFYVQLLQPGCSEEEQTAAAEGLWTLMFKCWSEVANEPGCVIALQNLTFSESDDVKHRAKGALWKLEDSQTKLLQSLQGVKPVSEDMSHVFISYQWSSQSMARKLANSLKDAGYNVWIDIENMSESPLEDMITAVEKAAVVIICLSQRYKDSPDCRTEAEYSLRLKKDVLPILMQPNYVPDGWLRTLVGKRRTYDFSSEEIYRKSIRSLIKELRNRGKAVNNEGLTTDEAHVQFATEETEDKTASSASDIEDDESNPDSDANSDISTEDDETESDSDSEIDESVLTNEEYLNKLESRIITKMYHLSELSDFLCEECNDFMKFLLFHYQRGSQAQRRKVGDMLSSLGVTNLFLNIWEEYFEADFLNDDNELMNEIMTNILNVMWNYTDASNLLCRKVFESDLPNAILRYLNSDYLDPQKTKESRYEEVLMGLLSIPFNMVQAIPESSHALREQKAVDVFQRFRNSPNEEIACLALILQAYIINEEENERVNSSNDTDFIFLKKTLESALKPGNSGRRACGFKVIEIISALNRLAVNDSNKKRIVTAGLLPFYVQLLQPECPVEEQAAAVEGLWTLMFKCWEEVENEPGCVSALQNLKDKSHVQHIKRLAEGALWKLDELKRKQKPAESVPNPNLGDKKHIFISYKWDSQPMVMKLSQNLKKAGYEVWLDLDNMSGSVMDSMTTAVEKAAAVIVCFSQSYKDSPNCRSEAEYAFRLNKEILPLRLQPRYYPDGWLGLLLGSRFVYDFSSDEKYEQSFQNLLKNLGDKGKTTKYEDFVDHPNSEVMSKKAVSKTQSSPGQASNQATWSTEEVVKWLKKNGIKEFQDWLDDFDGSLLKEYKSMLEHAPGDFYPMLKDKKVPREDVPKLCKALRELNI